MFFFLLFSFLLLGSSCGDNFFRGLSIDGSDKALMVEAEMLLNQNKYLEASTVLKKITQGNNRFYILLVSSNLGISGLDIWAIVKDIINTPRQQKTRGADSVLENIGEKVLGEIDQVRTLRITALETNIAILAEAPNQQDNMILNSSCFLAGVLALPTLTDSVQVMNNAQKSLASVLDSSTGAGQSAEECPSIGALNDSLNEIIRLQNTFSTILKSADKCNFLDISGPETSLNAVEMQLNRFSRVADRGCENRAACEGGSYCDALTLGCVEAAFTTSEKTAASDGLISTCELVQNCIDPNNCF